MRRDMKPLWFGALIALLLALDVSVAIAGAHVTAERFNAAKAAMAVFLQAVAVALLFLFAQRPRKEDDASLVGPLEQIRASLTPYFVFALALALTLSLLYDAVACGEQSFFQSRKGEPTCKL